MACFYYSGSNFVCGVAAGRQVQALLAVSVLHINQAIHGCSMVDFVLPEHRTGFTCFELLDCFLFFLICFYFFLTNTSSTPSSYLREGVMLFPPPTR